MTEPLAAPHALSARPAGVDILADPAKAWRWIARLAGDLDAAGVPVVVRFADGPARERLWDILEGVEDTLFGRPPERNQDRLPLAAFERFQGVLPHGAVTLDLTGRDPPDGGAIVPLFDGSPRLEAAVAAVLDGRRPVIGATARGRALASFPCAVDDLTVVSRALDQVLAGTRALCRDLVSGPPALSPRGLPGAEPSCLSIDAATVAKFVARTFAAKVLARLTGLLRHPDHWRVGWRRVADSGLWDGPEPTVGMYAIVPDDGQRYFADPFVVSWQDKHVILVEEFPYATGKGIISFIEIGSDGSLSSARPVIDCAYHMSYPQTFAWNGDLWMLPETSANRTVELWRAERFPDRWARHSVLLDDVAVADATLFQDGEDWWMLGTVATDGGSAGDALHAWYAQTPAGPWRRAGTGAVMRDSRCARPAGAVRRRPDGLWRPAQDNSATYGGAVALCRIDLLSRDGAFQQTVERRIAPPTGMTGFHTLNVAAGVEVIDLCGPRSRRAGAND